MSDRNVIRAWKDAEFRASMADDEVSGLPENPAGELLVPDEMLDDVSGGESTEYLLSLGCCQGFTDECAGLTTPAGFCTAGCITIWLTTESVCKPKAVE